MAGRSTCQTPTKKSHNPKGKLTAFFRNALKKKPSPAAPPQSDPQAQDAEMEDAAMAPTPRGSFPQPSPSTTEPAETEENIVTVISREGGEDDVSTLQDPYVGWGCDIIPEPAADNTVDGSMISSEHRGYVWAVGRQRLGTGGGESSTLGGGTLGTGPFMDDTSFEQMYRTPDGSEYEERGTDFKRVTVAAPAGKLGIVVDNPNGDVPVIVGVKETSVLHGRVHAGDVLISVDEVDCRGMSAMQVSKLISGRSHNPARTLVLGRSSAGC